MDDQNGERTSTSLCAGEINMGFAYFPAFLYLSLGFWFLLFLFFLGFCLYLRHLPDDRILQYRAKAIENKKRLGIKIYKF
jgi:hypothetical protein